MGTHLEGGGLGNPWAMVSGGPVQSKQGTRCTPSNAVELLKAQCLGGNVSGRMRHITDSSYLNSNTDTWHTPHLQDT